MLVSLVLLALAVSPLGLLARREPRPLIAWGLALVPMALFAALCAQIPTITAGGQVEQAIPWVPALGLELRFSLDGLSLLFALIISGIGALIVGYAGAYMAKDAGLGRFLTYLLLFMAAMLGLVLAGNVLTMFVFWELTSVTSYLLIGYKHDDPDARRGAQQSLLVTAGGGLALLVGLLLLAAAAQQTGVPASQAYNFDAIIAAGEQIKATALYTPAVALVFLGAFTKSAQFPFHFWLPGAMQAPTPASAFLHSATMVKAGVYLLARLAPGLGETPLWNGTLVAVGGFTFAFGAIVAFRQHDIKALLAYTTLSQLGGLVLLIGLGGTYGAEALVTAILAHALYKSSLFLLAGVIDKAAGTRDLGRLGGLGRLMPRTAAIAAVALLSQMGIPPLLGFIAKEWTLKAALASPLPAPWPALGLTAAVIAAIGYIVAAWRLFRNAFLGPASDDLRQRPIADPRLALLISPAIPAALSLILSLGLLPAVSALLSPAAAAVYGAPLSFELYLFKGIDPALVISVGAILAGLALASQERRLATVGSLPAVSGAVIFDRLTDGLLAFATAFTRRAQAGRLRTYILYSMLALLVFAGVPFVSMGLGAVQVPVDPDLQLYELIAAALIPVGVIATIRSRSRLGAIISVSVVGAMVALFFVLFSAPDLALTQLLIEVLSTVFLLLVFSVLPARFVSLSSGGARVRDGAIAVAVGALMGGLALVTAQDTGFASIAPYFLQNSLDLGKGANVVNVILVDFRGIDTLGEATVLFIAMLGIYGLLRFRTQREEARPSELPAPAVAPVADAAVLTGAPRAEPVEGKVG